MIELIDWYQRVRRDLPWRRTRDPYAIWVSEIMLQQTQVATVIPYFERWMTRFPTVEALAAASLDEVLALWSGLGYYRRARMLHEGACQVVVHGMPRCSAEWRKVPGVGEYTAGAIASIGFGERVPAVDGNVARVYARLCADDTAPPALLRKAAVWSLEAMAGDPADWTQALMELGATVCTPTNPQCEACPVAERCLARQQGRITELPVKAEKPSTIELKHVVLVPVYEGAVGMRQIPKGQWWHGMWECPRGESRSELELLVPPGEAFGPIFHRHVVTRHKIEVEAWLWECSAPCDGLRWVPLPELEELAVPAPQRRIIAKAAALIGL